MMDNTSCAHSAVDEQAAQTEMVDEPTCCRFLRGFPRSIYLSQEHDVLTSNHIQAQRYFGIQVAHCDELHSSFQDQVGKLIKGPAHT